MEVLIGAIAIESSGDTKTLERAADNLLFLQLTYLDRFLKETYYDLLGAWHQKRFGVMPSYELYDLGKRGFGGTIRFWMPENDKGVQTNQRIDVDAGTRSKARESAAFMAYGFIRNQGLWINLKDAGLVPRLENSINQLKGLYQEKYLDEAPKYELKSFIVAQEDENWHLLLQIHNVLIVSKTWASLSS